MNNLRKKMTKSFAQKPTVTGLQFKPCLISSREVSAKLPQMTTTVTQVFSSREARQNSLRTQNLNCAWYAILMLGDEKMGKEVRGEIYEFLFI